MLRVQQYEKLLKAILALHELAGPVDTLEAQRASRAEKLADKSLGTLVKTLFETYVVPEGFERDLLPDDKTPADKISMAFGSRLSMTPERWSETKAAIEDVVVMRNELVHHLIDKFDLWTDEGCASAITHLEESYKRIDQRYAELVNWAKSADEARGMAAQFAQTPVFQDSCSTESRRTEALSGPTQASFGYSVRRLGSCQWVGGLDWTKLALGLPRSIQNRHQRSTDAILGPRYSRNRERSTFNTEPMAMVTRKPGSDSAAEPVLANRCERFAR